ncbi:MAG: leucine-rich repeat protein [Lachnospiraceae bacterium]|nr:leucine-rich repeat protein [Lachnospiraceae bacterium]
MYEVNNGEIDTKPITSLEFAPVNSELISGSAIEELESWYRDYKCYTDDLGNLYIEKCPTDLVYAKIYSCAVSDNKLYNVVLGYYKDDYYYYYYGDEAEGVFQECTELIGVEIEDGVKASSDISRMFYGCTNLTEIDFNGFDTSNTVKMSDMFDNCPSLTNLDLSRFDTSSVEQMEGMFCGCTNLNEIDLSGFDTSKVNSMQFMFAGCEALRYLELGGFDTSKVENMAHMFDNVYRIKYIDMSGFTFDSVTNIEDIFYHTIVQRIKTPRKVNSSLQVDFYYPMVEVVNNVSKENSYNSLMEAPTSSELVLVNEDDLFDPWYSEYDYYVNKSLKKLLINSYKGYDRKIVIKSQTFIDGAIYDTVIDAGYDKGLFENCSTIASVEIEDGVELSSLSRMFYGCKNLMYVKIGEEESNRFSKMDYMFYNCEKLEYVDIEGLDTSRVSDFSHCFEGCKSLGELDCSFFMTTVAADMSYMFSGCAELKELSLDSFNTSQVQDMSNMFSGCKQLINLDLSTFDVFSVSNMSGMFYKCSSLESVDLSSFSTYRLKDISNMFYGCTSLNEVDLSLFDMSKIKDSSDFLYGTCIKSIKTPLKIGTSLSIKLPEKMYEIKEGVVGSVGYYNLAEAPCESEIGTIEYIDALSPSTTVSPTVTQNPEGDSSELYYNDGNGFEFEFEIISGDRVKITKYLGIKKNITIPYSFILNKTYYIAAIGKRAFYGTKVTNVSFENGITYIDDEAFMNSSLTSITVPMVDKIGDSAFYGCSNLKDIGKLLDYVTSIGECAFCNCNNLTAPTEFSDSLTSIGDLAFFGCKGSETIKISEYLTSIGYGIVPTNKLKEVTVAEKNPKYDSRNNCNGIIEKPTYKLVFACDATTIPDDIVVIGKGAYYGSTIKKINMPDSVKLIEDHAFAKCQSLMTIGFSSNLVYIGKSSFSECTNLSELTIPGNVKIIDCKAFEKCSELSSLTIEEGVVSIGGAYRGSFEFCYGLETITLPESIRNMVDIEFEESITDSDNEVEICLPKNSYADWIFKNKKSNTDVNYTISYSGDSKNPVVEFNEEDTNTYVTNVKMEEYIKIDISEEDKNRTSIIALNNALESVESFEVYVEDETIAKAEYTDGCLSVDKQAEGITFVNVKSNDALGVEGLAIVYIYDSSKSTDQIAIDKFIEKIKAIGYDEDLSYPQDVDKVNEAREVYDGLSDYQKNIMDYSYYIALVNAEEMIDKLKIRYDTNIVNVNEVKELIKSIVSEGVEYTDECDAKISAAEKRYDHLDDDFKALVDNYTDLLNARNKYNTLRDNDNKEKAQVVINMILDLVNWNGTLEDSHKITDARVVYELLTDDQKAIVGNTNLKMLENYEAKLEKLKQEQSQVTTPSATQAVETEEPIETKSPSETKMPVSSPTPEATVSPTQVPTKQPETDDLVTELPVEATSSPSADTSSDEINSLQTAIPKSDSTSTDSTPVPTATATSSNRENSSGDSNASFSISVKSSVKKNRTYVFSSKYGKAMQVRYVKAVDIRWSIQSDVTLYKVYRSESQNGKYICINETSKNRYLDSKVSYGRTYFYKVECIKNNGSYESSISSAKVPVSLIRPILKINNKAGKFIMLSYIKSEGEFQEVQALVGKKWAKANTMCGRISRNKVCRPLNSTNFYLRVRTYTKYKGKKIYSKWSKKVHV